MTRCRIRQLRKDRGWSLDDLASRAHVGLTTLRKLESGETKRPRQATADRIAGALEVPAEDLFSEPVEWATTGHDPAEHGLCDDCGAPRPHSYRHCIATLRDRVDVLTGRLADDVHVAYIEGHLDGYDEGYDDGLNDDD